MVNDGFRSLIVWQKSLDLVERIYRIVKQFPANERFGLMSQLCRAVTSVPTNIAEGYGRHSKREFRQFLTIALGSLTEVEALLEISRRLAYLDNDELTQILKLVNEVARLLYGLRRSVSS